MNLFKLRERGDPVPDSEYRARVRALRTELLQLQQRLLDSSTNVLILVSGVEGAGKGDVVQRLNTWLDTRGIQTLAFWDVSSEERERPEYWRFWRELPPRGKIGILFGSWYTRPIVDRAHDLIGDLAFEHDLERIREFERTLSLDGTLILKFWFHLSKKAQRRRLRDLGKDAEAASPYTKKYAERYDDFVRVSERALRATETDACPWHVIDSKHPRHRDLSVGEALLEALRERLEARTKVSVPAVPDGSRVMPAPVDVLSGIDLDARLKPKAYRRLRKRYQRRLGALAWRAREAGRNTVAVFEGWDAAGKSGAIRRVSAAVDARLYRVISVAAPSDEERARHYLWRFWRHVPRAGQMTLYDRSWYGRVLVERVEGFASPQEWQRAYEEINSFEKQLIEHGAVLLKFWVHLSPEEQLERFQARERAPWKRHKITAEDWRNREKRGAYEEAVQEMIARTNTAHAPWTLIPGDDKRLARVEVLRTFCHRLETALDEGAVGAGEL